MPDLRDAREHIESHSAHLAHVDLPMLGLMLGYSNPPPAYAVDLPMLGLMLGHIHRMAHTAQGLLGFLTVWWLLRGRRDVTLTRGHGLFEVLAQSRVWG